VSWFSWEDIPADWDVKLPGRHNRTNLAAAAAVGRALDVDIRYVRKVAENFEGLEHRLEFVLEHEGVRYYNDSAATAPDAALAALNSFEQPMVLIAGGADKDLDYTKLGQRIDELGDRIRGVVLLEGTAADKMAEVMGPRVLGRFDEFEAAVAAGAALARPGDVVLLSPGCASFGMFKNEFHRGVQGGSVKRIVPRSSAGVPTG